VTAGIIVYFIQLKDEKFGFLSYIKNYFMRIIVSVFVSIYLIFVLLSIYFLLVILSLHKFLREGNRKKMREIGAESRLNLNDLKTGNVAGSSGSIQLIPLTIPAMNSGSDEISSSLNGKFFILHV
jgi:hypothetical protein